MKALAIAFALVALAIVAALTVVELRSASPDYLAWGTLVVLTLTLVVLVWYAYDTSSLANLARERWAREGVLNTTYSLILTGKKGEAGRTLVQLQNHSPLVVRARLNFNFKVYGVALSAGPLYDGETPWLIFPQQMVQGWFEVDSLVRKRGKDVAAMIAESKPDNRSDQLTMLLEVEFSDELGQRRKLPARHHYFDFERWAWIPQLADTQTT